MKHLCLALIAMAISADVASADPPGEGARAYAIIVGSNSGGEGQQPLRFAERDAERVRAVFAELGSYEPASLQLLLGPDPAALWRAFDKTATALAAHAARGEPTVFVFYYSGHARSSAIDLGDHQVPLDALRDRIAALPSTLSVVLLDACQSGAYSNVKGAEPAADFSVSSVARLTTSGVAVLASSTATELSQESPRLSASYFTHHLVTGLRGAADDDGDGRVSLAEVYRYAYDHTLMSTAVSAVGRQHVTLETDLRGKGDVPLTVVTRGDAELVIPASVSGTVLIANADTADVVAEIQKVSGEAIALALPDAGYRVIVRAGQRARGCDVTLGRGDRRALAMSQCEPVAIDSTAGKHAQPPAKRFGIELGFGIAAGTKTAFTDRLEDFGYNPPGLAKAHLSLLAEYALYPRMRLIAEVAVIDDGRTIRHTDGASTFEYRWHAYAASIGGRLSSRPRGWFIGFVEAKAGLTLAPTELIQDDETVDRTTHGGFLLGAAIGAHMMPWERFGFTWRLGGSVAPTITNELGDTHDSGGVYASFAGRFRF